MSVGQVVALAAAAVLVFWMLGAYNRLVALRNAIAAAWQQVDDALGRRGDMLTELVTLLRRPLAAEAAALDAVLAALAQVTMAAETLRPRPTVADAADALVQAEARLAAAQARLLALVDPPPPTADPALRPALDALRDDVAPRLAFARQQFNETVLAYNEAARALPTRLLTRLYGFGTAGRL